MKKPAQAAVTFQQKRDIQAAAQSINVTVADLLRGLIANAPSANELPPPVGAGKVYVGTPLDEGLSALFDEKREDMNCHQYMRRVVEWGLRQ